MKFIYVFSKKDKETLQKAGFILLKEDEKNDMYVFNRNDTLTFALADMSYLTSDTLTF